MIIYATNKDAGVLRTWINGESEIAWIIKSSERDLLCRWRAVSSIDRLEEQRYALWHVGTGSLNIPSAEPSVPDAIVADPFSGWAQVAQHAGQTSPWFGNNLPGPYTFKFAENGREAPGSLARSDFEWQADRFKSVGKPAHPEAKRWWNKLIRFIDLQTVQIPWAPTANRRRTIMAHVFPEAYSHLAQGRIRDINSH